MRVTKGSKFKGQIWKGVCRNCDAEYECDRVEIEKEIVTPTKYGARDGVDYALLNCTECDMGYMSTVRFLFHKTSVAPPTDGEVRP